ncbi:MAG: S46 family peptidase [Bacteroidales bacterium]|nr:S46 family peptidase [Bacteroidales bacterium]
MRNRLVVALLFFGVFINAGLRADEGMWIPILIEKYNIKLMQEKGFKLSAEDIYSVNKACMKDAVLIFGGGCTGEIISGEGLLITNHHCGYGQIQEHSSLENDYLRNGFWAMSRKEELTNPGLTVTILKRMEDVTTSVLNGVTDAMDQTERENLINKNISEIQKKAVEGTGYRARITPFYMGNQYFLFVNETFRDIRLVGAPPSAIGKFGGETDNWIWPRHTGDFSIFRIYANKNNQPADYSNENVPYKPAYFFPISIKGVKEGDFTMVFGYPGSTSQYVPSYHIDMVKNFINPKIIDIRTKKIEIMEAAMNTDPLIRIQYSAKKSGIANSWKKWQGEIMGLDKMNTIETKKDYETKFAKWVEEDASRSAKYGMILPSYKDLYDAMKEYTLVNNYTNEVFSGAEVISMARSIKVLSDIIENNSSEEIVNAAKTNLLTSAKDFFKDYNMNTDKKIFVAVMKMYGETLGQKWLIPEYVKLRNSCKGDFEAATEELYSKSVFADEAKFISFVKAFNKSSVAKVKKDQFYVLAMGVTDFMSKNVRGELARLNAEIQKLNKLYMTAQMEFDKERIFYPDANFTLRVTFGQVGGYKSKDAVYYTHYTTLKGIIEKDNPEIFDYDVPDKLKELYAKKDFGRYTQDGEVPVCFIANNHTTGGNSGSPVLNADGQLIGVNFDRAWEGVASDMAFNPDQSRNISLDIRYALFIIDKFAGAGYLLNEMKIVE